MARSRRTTSLALSTLAVTAGLATALPATASAAVVAENQAQTPASTPQLTPNGIVLTGDIDASGMFTGSTYVTTLDPLGMHLKYLVDWGDGSAPSGGYGVPIPTAASPMALSHQYASHGIFKITVMVDEDNGQGQVDQTFSRTWHYAAAPTDPNVGLTSPGGDAPFTAEAEISGGTVDPAATKGYTVDWGDGSPVETHAAPASGPLTLHHLYSKIGQYKVTTHTTDGVDTSSSGAPYGANTTWATAYGLTVSATVDQIGDATLSHEGFGPITGKNQQYVLRINWGDGSPEESYPPANENQQHHLYAKTGTYTITVTLADEGLKPDPTLPHYTATTSVVIPHVLTLGVDRTWGMDRYQTSAAVAGKWAPGSADAVVLARGDAAPDALTGVPFAAHVKGPLLLTQPSAMPGVVRDALDRVTGGPKTKKTVYILGGFSAVSQQQEDTLRTAGYTVVRLGGETRYETALKIAGQFGPTQHVIVATALNFPDALAAGPLGAVEKAPIVLTADTVTDPATAAFIRQHQDVDPVGGQAQKAVAALNTAGQTVEHSLAGGDRYATAVAVASHFWKITGFMPSQAGLASGLAFPDSLSGGAYAAKLGMPLLLTDPRTLTPATGAYLAGMRQARVLQSVEIFGGPEAVSPGIQSLLGTL